MPSTNKKAPKNKRIFCQSFLSSRWVSCDRISPALKYVEHKLKIRNESHPSFTVIIIILEDTTALQHFTNKGLHMNEINHVLFVFCFFKQGVFSCHPIHFGSVLYHTGFYGKNLWEISHLVISRYKNRFWDFSLHRSTMEAAAILSVVLCVERWKR